MRKDSYEPPCPSHANLAHAARTETPAPDDERQNARVSRPCPSCLGWLSPRRKRELCHFCFTDDYRACARTRDHQRVMRGVGIARSLIPPWLFHCHVEQSDGHNASSRADGRARAGLWPKPSQSGERPS